MGIGASPAVIRVSYEAEDEPQLPQPLPRRRLPLRLQRQLPQPSSTRTNLSRSAGSSRVCLSAWASLPISESARENSSNVNLSGSGMGAIISSRGETLDAIQHLTNYVVNRGSEKRLHISVDAECYRSKREESLTRLAEKMAEKAIKYKRSMALEPMNSYERHVIHTALQNYEGVTTSSTGVEPNRRVVVSYVKLDKSDNKPQSREWA
ncbi:MAG: RNA-binding cell elongation regulator Jag/EloR [Oscillospiraceae bacterium]